MTDDSQFRYYRQAHTGRKARFNPDTGWQFWLGHDWGAADVSAEACDGIRLEYDGWQAMPDINHPWHNPEYIDQVYGVGPSMNRDCCTIR